MAIIYMMTTLCKITHPSTVNTVDSRWQCVIYCYLFQTSTDL